MIALLLYLGTTLQQADTLTLTEPGARVPIVLHEIAERTGLPLRSASELDNRVLCLRLENFSVEAALTRIARVLDAEWRISPSARTLIPSPATVRRRQEKAQGAQATTIE